MNFDKVAVISASSYLGSALYKANFGEQVIGTYFSNKYNGLNYLDLRNEENIIIFIAENKPNLILYSAGLTDVDKCQSNPKLAYQLNFKAVEIIARFEPLKVVYFSTDYVFNGKVGHYEENARPNPINVYGESKHLGEQAVMAGNPNNLVIRISGLFGTSGFKGDRFETASKQNSSIYADDNRFSSPIALDDVVKATKLLLSNNLSGIYHVSGSEVLSRYEYQQLFVLFSGKQRKVIPTFYNATNYFAPRPLNSSLSNQKMKKLGWKHQSVPQALISSFNQYKKNYNKLKKWDLIENKKIKAILLDCVGAVLSKRNWLNKNPELEFIDKQFGSIKQKKDIKIFNQTDLSIDELINIVTDLYVPNPVLWYYLPYLKHEYKLALVNNGLPETFRKWVNKYGLDKIFHALVNSSEIGTTKPNKKFYQKAMEMLGVSPEECLLIDDIEENIIGAQESGIDGIKSNEIINFPVNEYHFSNLKINDYLFNKIRYFLAQAGVFYDIEYETILKDIGVDSLNMVILLSKLEETLKVRINNDLALDSVSKVKDLIKVIIDKNPKL